MDSENRYITFEKPSSRERILKYQGGVFPPTQILPREINDCEKSFVVHMYDFNLHVSLFKWKGVDLLSRTQYWKLFKVDWRQEP